MVTDSKTRRPAQFERHMFLGVLVVLFFIPAPYRVNAQARKMELADLQKIVGVSSPAISPDGKSIVIVVSRVNWDEDRYDSQLVLVDIATGAQRPLTGIRKGLSSPQFSPSGDRLALSPGLTSFPEAGRITTGMCRVLAGAGRPWNDNRGRLERHGLDQVA